MIPFNVPPFVGKEKEYINEVIANRKICGDGFSQKMSGNPEDMTKSEKCSPYNLRHGRS